MPVQRLNHAVLYVRNVAASVAFYTGLLGFETLFEFPGTVFLRAGGSTNDHDLGLFEVGAAATASVGGRGGVGLCHLAWEVETLAELARLANVLDSAHALVGSSDHGTTKSLHCVDPDGLEFEVCWLVPADRVASDGIVANGVRTLDLSAEIARFGALTRGGVGISHFVPA
jgi:catechol-2,3-dioxygenase